MKKNKQNRRRTVGKPAAPKPVNWRKPVIATGSLVIVAALVFAAGVLLDRPFSSITVLGEFQRVTTLQVEGVVQERLTGGFVSVDMGALREGMSELAWIDTVTVHRRWPGRLVVKVTEQVAAARWGDSGLLNLRGELFVSDARHVPPELPRLHGPPGSETRVAKRYLDMSTKLREAGFELRALELDARGAWRISLANGIEIRLGRLDIEARMDRFIDVVAAIIQTRIDRVAYVDLRYSNGFAVGWRTTTAPENRHAGEIPSNG